MPTNLGIYAIYAKYLKDLYEKGICKFLPHMESLQSTVTMGTVHILDIYH